jgi:3-oxoacyl-[acyl-carrier-protein] synthase-3
VGAAITGWGSALPEKVVTNDEFAARLDTSDSWIVERTGISTRHIGGTTSSLSIEAGQRALERAGALPSDVDLLILSTSTPDQAVPATSGRIHSALGCSGAAFDLNAACAGYVFALVTAHALLGAGYEKALVIGADVLTQLTDFDDRNTAVLFGDGAGAVVIDKRSDHQLLVAFDLGVDGSAMPILYCNHGAFLQMEGREVFRRAVRAVVESATTTLARGGVSAEDIALFVPHQANVRIIEAVTARIGIPIERTAIVLDHTGNTSSASIPLALADAADHGRLSPGDLILLSGFGAGLTWGSAILRWGS